MISESVLLYGGRPVIWSPHRGPQARFIACGAYESLYGGAAGGGKMLRLDEPVPTPSGWTTVGDLRVGDAVFGRDGRVTTVAQLFAVELDGEAYRFTFDDGTEIEACADHAWLTFDARELSALTKTDPAWRSARRSKRPSRATGRRSAIFTLAVSERNRRVPTPVRPVPAGTVRTTEQIVATLRVGRRANHAIPVADAIDLPEALLPVDPYVLGVWLGDGTSRAGSVTSDCKNGDQVFLREQFANVGWPTSDRKDPITFAIHGLVTVLRKMGVLANKHIPPAYLRGSQAQRLALLQGLMDTDGTVCSSGSVEFTNTNYRLAIAVHEIVMSLGWKGRLIEGRATIDGRDVGPKWDLKWTPSAHVFRLPRKRSAQKLATRRTTRFRYVVKAERVPSSPMRCLRVSGADHMFLVGRSFLPTHNSDALLAGFLLYVNEPRYSGIIFRRTFPQLSDMIERSYEIFGGSDPGADYNIQTHVWRFSSGARLAFSGMEHEKDKYNHKSKEYQYIGFDQLEDFSESQYTYLFSRGRSSIGVPVRIRGSANPGGTGQDWIMRRFGPWLDPKCGTHADPGEVLYYQNTLNGQEWCERGKKTFGRVFIPALRSDNPSLDGTNYDDVLMGLDPVTREQLKNGNWLVRSKAGDYFKREWVIGADGSKLLESAPKGVRWVRYWDRAATEPSKASPNPDWTRGVRMGVLGSRIIIGHVASCRKRPAGVQDLILQTAALDGKDVEIGIEQDPAAAGIAEADAYLRMLRAYYVRKHPVSKAKVTRFKPFSAQAEAGNVEVVRGDWNEAYFNEMEAFFDPDVWKDDQADATSGAYTALMDDEESTASDWVRASKLAKKRMEPTAPEVVEARKTTLKAARVKLGWLPK